jgi:hypothetical protein
MLDVHPPHQAAHSWRDFAIHMVTIVLGLLIAIGLEQTVEALHRSHLRHELVENIHGECESNLKVLQIDTGAYKIERDWDQASVEALADAQATNGSFTVTLPSQPDVELTYAPSRAVWSIAKSNGKVALLPESVAEVYDRLDRQGEEFFLANEAINEAHRDAHAVAIRLRIKLVPGGTLHVAAEQREAVLTLLARESVVNNSAALWSATWAGACHAVLDGVQSREAMNSYLKNARGSTFRD